VTLKVTLEADPATVPLMVLAETVPLPPEPMVSVTPSLREAAPMVIVADPAARVVFAETVVAPRVMTELVVETDPATVVAPAV
jgi:hypothetical protein